MSPAIPHAGRYRPDIDGLRAVAILAVLAFHAFPAAVPGGFVGVDVFFVISGYLITGLLLDDLALGRFGLVDFYKRRIRRIFPALLVVLAACLAYGWINLRTQPYAQLGRHVGAGAGFVANLLRWS
jgi:peptidoglycan/LPS O-acetylase OafA/YrhL